MEARGFSEKSCAKAVTMPAGGAGGTAHAKKRKLRPKATRCAAGVSQGCRGGAKAFSFFGMSLVGIVKSFRSTFFRKSLAVASFRPQAVLGKIWKKIKTHQDSLMGFLINRRFLL
ncbi:hypothetical protein EDM56_06710 [Brevibacillus fluminis]|uniref:Uncharacterized protein n=1 Tax=Brevibacillus fluminis TaxID=511487 RepID=A0A3M8DT41_9BACL|nr:hypothetical protein EDM56_06710 [Brevibacillus fluminis]